MDTSDLSILADVEHFLLSEVQWDPTGRYVTAITCTAGKVRYFRAPRSSNVLVFLELMLFLER